MHMATLRDQGAKGLGLMRWLPAFWWQRLVRRIPKRGALHLIVAVADHFEPSILPRPHDGTFAPFDEQERKVEEWCRAYPAALGPYRDADGRPFVHTYFFPAEQYHKAVIDRLAEHCHSGWGEIEIHLHHGTKGPDTPENTRSLLLEFRDILAAHGCLSTWDGHGQPRYAFVHGNWALANSSGGRYCGVDNEMQILAETGCYADFTLPSAPDPAQTAKINSVYECALPLHRRAPHRRGLNLRHGQPPTTFPLIVQGPLAVRARNRGRRWLIPRVENGELSGTCPPTLERLSLWQRAHITVGGRPDWVFIKLHCHGMDSRDRLALLGPPMREFLQALSAKANSSSKVLHFVTAREMTNIILASCDGRDGNPGHFRDYRLRSITPTRCP